MSYGRIALGLGLALVALLALSAGITLAAQWKALSQAMGSQNVAVWATYGYMMGSNGVNESTKIYDGEHCTKMAKVGGYRKSYVNFQNLTEVKGTVKEVNRTKGFIVIESNGESYTVRLFKVYVRTEDGVLILGAWILANVKPGDSITVKGFGANGKLLAVEVIWGGKDYQTPAYYIYQVRHS